MWSPIPEKYRAWTYNVGMAIGFILVVYGVVDEIGYGAIGLLLSAISGIATTHISDDKDTKVGKRFDA